MSATIEGTINAALALQQHNAAQEGQANLIRKVLDNQADVVNQLLDSAVEPQLATTGTVGTRLHVTA